MIFRDVRHALRLLWKAPVFTVATISTLALAIGANTAIFSVVNAEVLQFLPYRDTQRLVWIWEKNDKLHLTAWPTSVQNYFSWKEQQRSFEQIGAIGYANYNLTGQGDPEQFPGSTITASLLPILGMQPLHGRSFRDEEERPGGPSVAMISEGLWKRRFGGDPGLVGRAILLNGAPYTVVGIAPQSLGLLAPGDIWTPLIIDPGADPRLRLNHVISAVGRLKTGVTLARAQGEMRAIADRVAQEHPEIKGWSTHVMTFREWFVNDQLRTTLLVLTGAVGLVLLIACANVANLLLARAAAREREVAIRLAIGADRGRLIRQFLTESLLLSLLGGAAGLLMATWALQAVNSATFPVQLPIPQVRLDAGVLWFAMGLTCATGLIFGLAPALRAADVDLNAVLKQSARSSVSGGRHFLRNGLVAGELALATLLLTGAGLLVQSLFHLQRVRVGFDERNLLTFQIALPPAKYADTAQTWAFWRRMIESFNGLPGVRAAVVSSGIPFGAGSRNTTPVNTVGATVLPPGTDLPVDWRQISPGYFRAMEIPLLSGRDFTEHDDANAQQVVIISRETAARLWGDAEPLGRIVHVVGSGKDFTVIGVVGSVRNATLDQEIAPAMYFAASSRLARAMDVAVRIEGDPKRALPALRAKLHDLDSEMPVTNVKTMEEWIWTSAAPMRFNAILLSVFAGVALLIATIGVYGVLSYSVSQRTREIGLRMALGARRAAVLQLVVREGMVLAGLGVGVGLFAELAMGRVLGALLFGIQSRDPITLAVVAATLGLVSVGACLVPARRASIVDPMEALRDE